MPTKALVRLAVVKSTGLLVSLPDARLRDALGEPPEGVEIVEWDMASAAPFDTVDIVVTPYVGAVQRTRALANVRTRLIQSQTLGYDGIGEVLPQGSVYANAKSVHETSTAEFTLALTLAAQRGIPDFVRAAELGQWAPNWYPSLADRNVLLLGYGGVGHAIETRLRAFEVNVVRVASAARSDQFGPVYGASEIPRLLPEADVVIVSVPLTDATVHLIDDRFLENMSDGALLVNVSRGRVADTAAVLSHATRGRLRFALDVTDPEPLPSGHPLFALANVLISPHVGGASSAMLPRMAGLVREQIDRMIRGDEPLNVVLRT
jgi:phosphoglycerate dehydrogenase-like enzyme